MNISSQSGPRLLATTLMIASIACFSMLGVAHAQQGTSGSGSAQGSATGQGGAKDPAVTEHGILDEGVDAGMVDQKKRVERSEDPRSPSPDSHVPPVRKDEKGRVVEDPDNLQGGPIGPN